MARMSGVGPVPAIGQGGLATPAAPVVTVGRYALRTEAPREGGRDVYALDPEFGCRVVLRKWVVNDDERSLKAAMLSLRHAVTAVVEARDERLRPVYDCIRDGRTVWFVHRCERGVSLEELSIRVALRAAAASPEASWWRRLFARRLAAADATSAPEAAMSRPEGFARLASRFAEALQRAHDMRAVHRNLSPRHLFVVDDDSSGVRITGFGVAALLDAAPGAGEWRQKGDAYRLRFAAPEVARDPRADADPRSDVYSLAASLLTVLHGDPPFLGVAAPSDLLVRARAGWPIPGPRRLPAWFDRRWRETFERALAPSVSDRFMTAAKFADSLRGVGSESSTAARGA